MFRQVGIGAVTTLTAGLLAVGCSSSSSHGGFVVGGGGDTPAQQFNGTSIAVNNVDPDGAAFTPNDTTFDDIKVVFSQNKGESDGSDASDNSAIVICQVQDINNNSWRVLASSYNGTFTQPVELQAEDRDEKVQSNIQSIVALQLNTASYGTASTQQVNDARANTKSWLILWDYTTKFKDPRLAQTSATTGLVGPHRTVAATVFLPDLRAQPVATSTKVGGSTANISRTFRYGFQEVGIEVPTVRQGAVFGHTSTSVQAPVNFPPACNVTSFGLISDSFEGQASFGGTALPLSDTARPSDGRLGAATSANVATNGAGSYTFAHPNQNGAALRSATYTVGEATNFVQLFYTQVVSSIATGGGSFVTSSGSSDGGADLKAFVASFNLSTLTFGAKTEFTAPVERNTGALTGGTGFYPSFKVYNQHVFFKYCDASLDTNVIAGSDQLSLTPVSGNSLSQRAQIGHEGKTMGTGGVFYEDVIGVATVTDVGDGTSTIASTTKRDLNFFGAAGAHDTTNPTSNAANSITINVLPNREIMNFNGGEANTIFGADEGLGDTTIFYLESDSTQAAGNSGDSDPGNIDTTICAACINADGTFAAGINPRRVSSHKPDFNSPGTDLAFTNGSGGGSTLNNALQDPPVEQGDLSGVGGTFNGRNGTAGANMAVGALTAGAIPVWFRIAMNRTGEYVALNWIQDSGQSSLGGTVGGTGFYQALFATVYQTFRPAVTGTGSSTTAANFEARFAAAQEVSTNTGSLALTQNVTRSTNVQNNGPETNTSWIALPVNWSSFQGGLGYRCGFQSNRLIMNMFYEQSDGTEDRLFNRALTVTLGATGTPTFALSTQFEFDSTPTVQGHQSCEQFQGGTTVGPATGSTATFRFLDGGIYNFQSIDLGPDATTLSASNQGGVLVVLAKVIDGTTSDNTLADAEVAAYELVAGTGGTGATRTSLSRNINENATVLGIQSGGAEQGGTLNQFKSTNCGGTAGTSYNKNFDTGQILRIVATPQNTDIASQPSYSPTRVDVIFSDSRTDNGSGATVLYCRTYDSKDRSTAAPKATVGDRFFPIGTVGSTAPAEPTRLDRLQGGDVLDLVAGGQAASAWFVVWKQDGHLWAQYTADGKTFRTTANAPSPPLVDDNNSENVQGQSFTKCENSSCDIVDGVLLIQKLDQTGGADVRGYLRSKTLP